MCDLINLEEETVSVEKKLQAPLIPAPLISKINETNEHLNNPFDSVLYATTEYEKKQNDPFEVVLEQASRPKNPKAPPVRVPIINRTNVAKPSERLIDVDVCISTNKLDDDLLSQEAGTLAQMFEELATPENKTYDLMKDDQQWMTELLPLSDDEEEIPIQDKKQTVAKLLLELENLIEEENNPRACELLNGLGKALGVESTNSDKDITKENEKCAIQLVVDFVKVLNGQTDEPDALNLLKKLDNALNLAKTMDKTPPTNKLSSGRRSLSDSSPTKIPPPEYRPRRSVSFISSPAKRKDKISKRSQSIYPSLKLMRNGGVCKNLSTMVKAGWEIEDIKHENKTRGPMKAIIPINNMLKKTESCASIATPCRLKPLHSSTPSNVIRSAIPKYSTSPKFQSNKKSPTTPLKERSNVSLKAIVVPRPRPWCKENKENTM